MQGGGQTGAQRATHGTKDTPPGRYWLMRALNHSWVMNHREQGCDFSGMPKWMLRKPCGGNTDLLGEEGHDGEDDQRHEDAVRPKLQLVPVHSPEGREKEKTYVSQL